MTIVPTPIRFANVCFIACRSEAPESAVAIARLVAVQYVTKQPLSERRTLDVVDRL
jgi:hypothetical protein